MKEKFVIKLIDRTIDQDHTIHDLPTNFYKFITGLGVQATKSNVALDAKMFPALKKLKILNMHHHIDKIEGIHCKMLKKLN